MQTIAERVLAIQTGERKAADWLEACLTRIESLDGQLRAWVVVDEDRARRAATVVDALPPDKRAGLPLAGVPIGIKDIIDVAGLPTRAGSRLAGEQPAGRDAPLVDSLRRAGAVILGKTVTTEHACFDPPPTRNPWNPDRTPGGSSSGSAVAVAADMCPAAIGTQTGGSINRPAAYCGVCGLKPTHGRISLERVRPISRHLDHAGPIARRVADLALLLDVLSPSDRQAQEFATLHPLAGYFRDQADAEVLAVCDAALDGFGRKMSHPIELPGSVAEVLAMHRIIMAVGAAETHGGLYRARPDGFGANIAALIEEGLATSPADYERAVAHQRRYRSEAAAIFPPGGVAVLPATSSPPPGAATTGDPRFNSPFSYAGLPALNFPCGTTADGMPIALQIVGPPHGEDLVLSAAAWCEANLADSCRGTPQCGTAFDESPATFSIWEEEKCVARER